MSEPPAGSRTPAYGPVPRYARPPAGVSNGSPAPAPVPPTAPSGPSAPTAPDAPPAPGSWPPPAPFAPTPPPPPWPPRAWAVPLRDDYASWGRRVAGAAVDFAPGWAASAVLVAGYAPTYAGLFRGDLAVRPSYPLVVVGTLLSLAVYGLVVYNRYILAGRTGQSFGKRAARTWLVSRETGRPVGVLDAFLRDLLHVLDGLGYVGYLWPLWDDERQTLADKIAQTVVVRTPVPPLTEQERRQR